MDQAKELELYHETVEQFIPINSRIVIKAHPASSREKNQLLLQKLKQNYDVFELDKTEIPIECMELLIKQSTIISFSSASISLKYLYGIPVIHALSNEWIKAFFYEHSLDWMLESNELYLKTMKDLEHLLDM
jgi:hypothetical protein